MSSRSNGVTKVEFTRRMMECVVSSAACSASFICAATPSRPLTDAAPGTPAMLPSMSAISRAPVTRWLADSVNRS